MRKAVLPRHAKSTCLNSSFSLLDFSFSLLVALPLLYYCQHACHHPANVASADAKSGHPFGAALARTHQGIALGVSKPMGSTPPLLALRGSLREFIADDDRRVAFVLSGSAAQGAGTEATALRFGWGTWHMRQGPGLLPSS